MERSDAEPYGAFSRGAIGGIVLHMLLVWQYRKGYSTQRALGIMGSVPLIIIAFVLPFLKLHVGFGEAGPDFAHAGHGVGPDGHLAAAEGAHGDLVHVKTYVRTAPDGDPTNNLSYHGPEAKPVNPEGLHIVKAHDRTMPDGDPATHQTGTVYVPSKGEAEPLMRPGQVLALLGMIGIIAALIWFIVDLKTGEGQSTNEPMIAESSAAASETPSRYWVVTSIQAKVRENPDPDAPVKKIIDQGMRLKFLEEQQSDQAGRLWYKVEVESDSITGWISSKIVREE